MGSDQAPVTGPDLRVGVPSASLAEGQPFLGQFDGEQVMLVRRGAEVFAVGATCTHYSGPLAEGMVTGEVIRCPWHHACFSLRTGDAMAAPALNPIPRWETAVRDGMVSVIRKLDAQPAREPVSSGPSSVVIVGAGAAGAVAAETLRREGYGGPITMVDPDRDAPYDRPNLSKDYLAGSAPEEWLPLRSPSFYSEQRIERVVAAATAIDAIKQTVTLSNGQSLAYGALLLATGATPIRPPIPGADLPHVHVLRSLVDCRALIRSAESAQRVVIAGASFIGMEAAAALRARNVEVTVVAPEQTPFVRTLGEELGTFLRAQHEEHGVRFFLGHTLSEIGPKQVVLNDGKQLDADVVLLGVGVRPAVALAEAAGLETDNGVIVDGYLQTSARNIFAAGDIARYPDPRTGERIRVEHWVVAERQGQAAARNILGQQKPFNDVPFFWTQQYDVPIAYVGFGAGWDRVVVEGRPEDQNCVVSYERGGTTVAVATINRDQDNLRAELELEHRGEQITV